MINLVIFTDCLSCTEAAGTFASSVLKNHPLLTSSCYCVCVLCSSVDEFLFLAETDHTSSAVINPAETINSVSEDSSDSDGQPLWPLWSAITWPTPEKEWEVNEWIKQKKERRIRTNEESEMKDRKLNNRKFGYRILLLHSAALKFLKKFPYQYLRHSYTLVM